MKKLIITNSEREQIKSLYEQMTGPYPPTEYKPEFSKFSLSHVYGGTKNISQDAVNLIKKYESYRPETYKCPSGKDTIGYGTRIDFYPECKGKKMSEQEATNYLMKTIQDHIIPTIKKYVKVPLSQNQLDALASLVYNIGTTTFIKSDLLKALNNKNTENIRKNWEEFRVSGGKVSKGLVNRRKTEIDMFFK